MFNKCKFIILKKNKFQNFNFLNNNKIIFFFEKFMDLNINIFIKLLIYKKFIFNYLVLSDNLQSNFFIILNLCFQKIEKFKYNFLVLNFNYLFIIYCKFNSYLLYNLFLKKLFFFLKEWSNLFFFLFLKKIIFFFFYGNFKSINKKTT